jgi:hypothetical protein
MISSSKQKISVDTILLSVILLVAAVLRFWNYSNIPYMHDELSALARTNFNSFSELIAKGARVDGHPVGVQVFLYYWTKLFGYGEMIVKLPFIICGLLSVVVVYRLSKFWFNSSVGLVASAFMAVLQYQVMYSEIARPYISGMFFSLLMVWYWSNYLFGDDEKKKRWLVGYILSSALCAYDHHFALLFAAIVGLTGTVFLNKKTWKGYLFSCVAIFVLYVPHLSIFFFQLNKGGVGGDGGWLGKPDMTWLSIYLKYVFHYSYVTYALVLLLVASSVFLYSKELKQQQKFRIISLFWFLLTFGIGYFYSIKVNPVLQFSTMIFVFPFFLIFLFSLFGKLKNTLKTIFVLSILIVGTTTLAITRKHFQVFYHQPYQEQILSANKIIEQIGDSKKATIELFVPPFFKEHYFKKYGKQFDCVYYNGFDETPNTKAFRDFVEKQTTDYFIAGNLPLEYFQIIKEKYPHMIYKEDGFTFSVYGFSKKESKDELKEKVVFSEKNDFNKHLSRWSVAKNVFEVVHNGPLYRNNGPKECKMDSTEEYGPTFTAKLKDIVNSRHNIINVSAEISSQDTSSDPTLVLEIHDGKESLLWRGGSYKAFNNKSRENNTVYVSNLFSGFDFKKHPNAEVKIYVWNRDKKEVWINNINIEVVESNPVIYGLYEPIEQ